MLLLGWYILSDVLRRRRRRRSKWRRRRWRRRWWWWWWWLIELLIRCDHRCGWSKFGGDVKIWANIVVNVTAVHCDMITRMNAQLPTKDAFGRKHKMRRGGFSRLWIIAAT